MRKQTTTKWQLLSLVSLKDSCEQYWYWSHISQKYNKVMLQCEEKTLHLSLCTNCHDMDSVTIASETLHLQSLNIVH